MSEHDPTAFLQTQFEMCRQEQAFVGRWLLLLRGSAFRHPGFETVHGAVQRALHWIDTLGQLDGWEHLQAVDCAARALFEAAVDLTLLALDPSKYDVATLEAWELSAHHRAGEVARDIYTKDGARPPELVEPMISFATEAQAEIDALRAKHWPRSESKKHPHRWKHPDRWTSHTLWQDAETADALFPAGRFLRWYGLRHAGACWNVHGSGLCGVRRLPAEMIVNLMGPAVGEVAHFALVATEMALRFLDLWDGEAEGHFARFRKSAEVDVGHLDVQAAPAPTPAQP
jgi:hypothetical protein